ncbi:MAG TPA: hypothetical protein VF424_01195 [Vicinamibacterales bacterium]
MWRRWPLRTGLGLVAAAAAAIRAEWERTRPAFINFLTRDLSKVRGHSARDAGLSPAQSTYRIVVQCGSALNFSSLAEDLASHGYLAAGRTGSSSTTRGCSEVFRFPESLSCNPGTEFSSDSSA